MTRRQVALWLTTVLVGLAVAVALAFGGTAGSSPVGTPEPDAGQAVIQAVTTAQTR